MTTPEIIIIGGGISGLSLAWVAAREGRPALVLEERDRAGGCLRTHRRDDGFWFEVGAHTVYNSYGSFLDVVEGVGLASAVVERAPARKHFGLLRNGEYRWLTPPKVLLQLNWLEAAVRFPFNFFRDKSGQSVESHFSRLIGPRNFRRVLSPFLSAVPSQSADGFPVDGPGCLFKKRPRREDFVRSFGFAGGLQTVCDRAAEAEGVTVRTGTTVTRLHREADGFAVTCADGETLRAPLAAVAVAAKHAAPLLAEAFPELAQVITGIQTVGVESMGVVLPRDRCWMPECAFVVPVDDVFFSAVTRDPFPDPERRSFTFHFRPGVPREAKLKRMSEVLRVPPEELRELVEEEWSLPAPAVGHGAIVDAIDRSLHGVPLALTGNYFAGLAIEDCVIRSNTEWSRISSLDPSRRNASEPVVG